ncbi:S-layer homology domain-containing protein [Lysinibacillus pakistanensis]|uniref:S-layer homology domain-containing protein n=1 Tax=Lysinibacillus pakistanensis TaxID=759811 RepID=UPI0034E58F87
MQITKQQKWWKRSLNTFLATALVASSVSFAGTPQKVKAAPTAGPGGVSDGLISWVDVERSKVITSGNTIDELTDLANGGKWGPYSATKNVNVPNALNFNGGLNFNGNSTTEHYTRLQTDIGPINDASREVFSVQASNNYSGFPWEFGGNRIDQNAVYGLNNGQTIRTYFGRDSGEVDINVGNYELKNGALLNVWSATDDWALLLNGKTLSAQDVNTTQFDSPATGNATDHYYIGAGHASRFNGKITETILFNRKLEENERKQVNSYLALKYGLTLKDDNDSLIDYISSDGSTTMWSAANNPGFGNRITGIGRDANGSLNQKQSKSQVNGANVTIALGDEIKATNVENLNSITNDKTFFTFSDNGEVATYDTTIDNANLPATLAHVNESTSTTKMMPRVFKVEKSDTWADQTITLKVDEVNNNYQYYLFVNDSDSAFPKATTTAYPIDQTTGTVTLDSNKFANGSFFTFVQHVDKKALETRTNEIDAENLQKADYPDATWTTFEQALAVAKSILTNPDKTATEVDAALTALTTARDNLALIEKPKPETAVLEQTAGANKVAVTFDKNIQVTGLAGFVITVDGTEVTPTGFEVIGDKLVLTFPNNPDVTDKAVKVKYDGTGNLQGTNGAAIEQFELPVEDPYSAAFQITKPDAVTANPQPTIGGKVDVTTTPSTVTIVLKNDKDEPVLVDVAAIVDPVTGDWTFTPPTDLPDGTYTIISTATNGQQTVTKKHTFTVATTPTVNKVPLQQKVEEAKNLVAGEYTPASWAQYQEALKKANEVLANPNATQEEVDAALGTLTGAQNALVKIGKGLGTLTPSTGTLSPSFQTGVTDYTMTVGYSTSVIDFTAIPVEAGATVTTTVNGQPGAIGQIPLQVGENIIVISVKDTNGNVRQYTIKVYREAYTGGGSWTPNPTSPVTPTPTPGDTKTKIQVELEIDGEKPLEKTKVEIERTKHANGDITDFVALTEANAKEAVAKAKEIGNNIARIVLPDVNDEVKEAKVEILKESLKLLRDNGLSLEISSENGHIAIPVSSMEGIDDNFYFRLVPVKKESERQAIEERARAERVVRETLQSNDVHVVARPMTIETNMPSRPVQVTLPLKGVKIPTNTAEREAFLKQLAVFIEHSDGEKKVVIPEVVTMAKGELGLRFTVEKFSTFTIIQVIEKEETKPPLEVKEHEAYIKGFPDGTFGPEKNVTRAQVATMIARILGYTDEPVNTAPFKDIPSDHYAAGAIAFVKERGIMNGDVNGNFHASENITRAQMATVVANFKQLSVEENVAITFNDTKGHWAQWIIEANRAAGIINGRQNGSFAPDEHLTRAQAVVMMNRMFERGPLQGVTAPSFPDVKATHWAFDEIEEAAKSHAYFIDEDGDEQLTK